MGQKPVQTEKIFSDEIRAEKLHLIDFDVACYYKDHLPRDKWINEGSEKEDDGQRDAESRYCIDGSCYEKKSIPSLDGKPALCCGRS